MKKWEIVINVYQINNYQSISLKYLTVYNKNKYTFFETEYPEITLIVFYFDINIPLFKREGELYICVHKLIPDDISTEQQLTDIMNVNVFFNNNRNINFYDILDDNDNIDNDDELICNSTNLYNDFATNKTSHYNIENNNPLNDERYGHEDEINRTKK